MSRVNDKKCLIREFAMEVFITYKVFLAFESVSET